MPKQTPKRMCIACRGLFEKNELTRVVRTPEGEILFDPTGKKPGRGAYLCGNPECFKKCVKGKILSKVFKTPISDEAYRALEEEYESK